MNHSYQEFANNENSVLVNPSGKISAVDNIFFHSGSPFNNGDIFDWNEDDFIIGCEKAIERYKKNPVNEEGLKLQE